MHWLDLYGPQAHGWQTLVEDGTTSYCRHIGVVEGCFDSDGNDLRGRADCQSIVTVKTDYKPTRDDVVSTWAYFRLKHPMLMARAVPGSSLPASRHCDADGADDHKNNARYFYITPPTTHKGALAAAATTMTFVADTYPTLSIPDFHLHVLNSSRIIDPSKSLSHLFVLSTTQDDLTNAYHTQYLFVHAHSITDGLTMFAWAAHFTSLFSHSAQSRLATSFSTQCLATMHYHLHPAQESLYPAVHPTNPARARWAWAITRVLRRIARPMGTPFPNPSRYSPNQTTPLLLSPTYQGILAYSEPPPTPTGFMRVDLSMPQTTRLKDLCKALDVSVGAGIFALLAITSMRCHELRAPDEPLNVTEAPKRSSPLWITSFPIDCRFHLPANLPHEGTMLSFSYGHALPLLASDIPFERRFRVLARAANRQLGVYQKGTRGERGVAALGLHGRSQALRALYLMTIERWFGTRPAHVSAGMKERGWGDPQGELAAAAPGGATHGISNLGSLPRLLMRLKEKGDLAQDAGAEMVDFEWSVRARQKEFLVGVCENVKGGMLFCVSYDQAFVDPRRVEVWKEVLSGMLEVDA